MNIRITIVLIVGSMIAVSADDNSVAVAIPSTNSASTAMSTITNCHLINNDKRDEPAKTVLQLYLIKELRKKNLENLLFKARLNTDIITEALHYRLKVAVQTFSNTEIDGHTKVKLRVGLEDGLDENLNDYQIDEYQVPRVEVKKVKKYHPIDSAITRNWTGAAKYCEDQAWKLASIESEEENDQVLLALSNAKYDEVHFWISGHEPVTREGYKWKYTNKPFSVSKWDRKEPSRFYDSEYGQNERCVEIRTKSFGRRWNDVPCNMNLGILCEEITDTIYEDCE